MKDYYQRTAYIKWLNEMGVDYYFSLEKDSKNLVKDINSEKDISLSKIHENVPKSKAVGKNNVLDQNNLEIESRVLANKASSILELRQIVENFEGCELKNFATNTVFADGIESAEIMLIGEAPGATEDEKGIPFCGESGKLLDNMLAAIGISRTKNAYITNTIFWRPPANRKPTDHEISICRPFVEKHIALIKPKLIILVGSTATTSLLGKNQGITFIRQNDYPYTNQYLTDAITTTAIFHPAYLLRQPMQKKVTWFDLLKIKEKYGDLIASSPV